MQTKSYLFTSDRLGFRNWMPEDLPGMAAINANPDVMEYFPTIQDSTQTKEFIDRMQQQLAEKGYCYFAVDKLVDGAFIGFVGLSWQTYTADFTPCVDIGWRLKKEEWNQGFATEGAKRCLTYAFNDLGLETIYAVAPKVNVKSEHIMQTIGMQKVTEFQHPLLENDVRLRECVLYVATKKQNFLRE